MARQGKSNRNFRTETPEFEQRIIDLARVTRVMAGGKRLRFRACVALGDKKKRVGWAVAKGADVTIAVNKAATKARKRLITIKFVNGTIPHQITAKFKAAKVLLKPAVGGTGIIAGGPVRAILELVGAPNIYGKILGRTNNKINNLAATIKALEGLKYPVKLRANEENKAGVDKEPAEHQERDLAKEEELEREQEKILKKDGVADDQVKSR